MTDHDRGAYTPQTDAPLAFDARQPRGGGGGGGGSPIALIISAVVLIALIGAVIVFYRGGVRGANEPPQPVGTPVGGIKTLAPAEPQTSNQTQAMDVYKSGEPQAAVAAAPAFAPAPEQPMMRPAPRPTLKVEQSDIPPISHGPPLETGPKRPVPLPPAPPAAAALAPNPVAPKPVAAEPKPVAAEPKPVAAGPAAPKPVAGAAGPATVQIGAFSSEALAAKGWSDVASAFPGDMSGKGRRTESVTGTTLHRSLITGFASRESAVAFCGKLKAAGRSCLVK